ncbi:hypothetical protein Syun_021237 [Stephania yunnanensis]|uniref:Uncharacterized protein n=1 Tax=Stephania yunnanensis TaxID=152371 RepID=A0AAP0IFP0_9MAGN
MSNCEGTSYNLRETQEIEEMQWHNQMEQCMSAMTETHQKAIYDMTTAQTMADLAQSQERNMTLFWNYYKIKEMMKSPDMHQWGQGLILC